MRRANPSIIGIFVLGAIALTVIAIIVFGSTTWWSKKNNFMVFFEESVNGLDVGSVVKFKGVPIGQVTNVSVHFTEEDQRAYVPVMVEVTPKRLLGPSGEALDLEDTELVKAAIKHGLRARLQFQSFVTGLLFIELNYIPDAPPATEPPIKTDTIVIPVIESGLNTTWKAASTMVQKISAIDFEGIGHKVEKILDDLSKGLEDFNFSELNATFVDAAQRMSKAGETVVTVSTHFDEKIDPLTRSTENAMKNADAAFQKASIVLDDMDSLLNEDSAFRYEIDDSLAEFKAMCYSIKKLADFLERNPQAILRGRKNTNTNNKVAAP
jgi:paraquat-inducible protein B